MAEASSPAIYVHLAWDGGIFVIRETGEQLWLDRDGLDAELRAAKERGDVLLYSRERGSEDPPDHVAQTFNRIADHELPIKLIEEAHPQALVAPEERRSIIRE
jgi:hypothetical protein